MVKDRISYQQGGLILQNCNLHLYVKGAVWHARLLDCSRPICAEGSEQCM